MEKKEKSFALKEQRDDLTKIGSKNLARIVQEKSSKAEFEIETQSLEEEIYEISINNSVKRSVREKLIDLLPEIVSSVRQEKMGKGGSFELVRTVQSIEEDAVRLKLISILQQQKVMSR